MPYAKCLSTLRLLRRVARILAAFAADLAHVLTVTTNRFTTFATDLRHMRAVLANDLSALAADGSHMLAILTNGNATFTGYGLARFGISRSQTTIRCFRIPYFSVQITVLHIIVFKVDWLNRLVKE